MKKPDAIAAMSRREIRKIREKVARVAADESLTLADLMPARIDYADDSVAGWFKRGRIEDARTKPIGGLDPTDLAELISFRYGHWYVLPATLRLLERDPMAHRQFGPGELLHAALSLPFEEWEVFPDLLARLAAVVDRVLAEPAAEPARSESGPETRKRAEQFRKQVADRISRSRP